MWWWRSHDISTGKGETKDMGKQFVFHERRTRYLQIFSRPRKEGKVQRMRFGAEEEEEEGGCRYA